MARHLLSLADLSGVDFLALVDRSASYFAEPPSEETLRGRSVGLYFKKTSTRTRTSFNVAAARLGAHTIAYGADDLQIMTGESMEDTARVLSGYLDALVIRTAGDPDELRAMASVNGAAIVNAMTADEHPTQAISDFAVLRRHFGRLEGLRLLYVGEGNNTATALALAASHVAGFDATFLTPLGYGLSASAHDAVRTLAYKSGAKIHEFHDPSEHPLSVDVVYTTRWQTTGTSKSDMLWRERFRPFQVTPRLMSAVSKPTGTVFMHDLPAVRGEDCEAAVLDGPQSVVFEQARQKLFSAMAVLEWCVLPRAE